MGSNPVRTLTGSVVFITVRIASISVSSTAVRIYDFHIFTSHNKSRMCRDILRDELSKVDSSTGERHFVLKTGNLVTKDQIL